MNKKGFTLVELLAVIAIIGVVSTIAVVSYNGIIASSRQKAYHDDEKSLQTAAENMLTLCQLADQSYCVDIPDYNETVTVTLDQLVSGRFIENIIDNSTERETCSGYVKVTNTSNSSIKLSYKTCLICSNYKSSDCDAK